MRNLLTLLVVLPTIYAVAFAIDRIGKWLDMQALMERQIASSASPTLQRSMAQPIADRMLNEHVIPYLILAVALVAASFIVLYFRTRKES